MITMSQYDNVGNFIENFRILTFLCHSQTTVMVAIVFFTEMLEWHWHYDHAPDSLYLTATFCIHLYVLFQHAFAIPIFSPLFDPAAPFQEVPLCMTHPATIPPSPSESDPSEMSASSSSSDPSGGHSPGDLRSAGVMENGFLSYSSTQRRVLDF